MFAGSWDKNIWSWDIATRQPGKKFEGHSDFVKALTTTRVSGKHLLISGGADKKIMVWDLATGTRLHTLQDSVASMMAVQSLDVDPVMSSNDEAVIISAGSDPQIRRWRVRLDTWEQLVDVAPAAPKVERRVLCVHETGVYKVVYDRDSDDTDIWTASADGTAKCLSREKGFTADETIQHGDHVRAVAVTDAWVITAGRDEDLKFWDKASGVLCCTLQGHYDEVTDLVVLSGGGAQRLVSVGIDGTVRVWPLSKPELNAIVEEQAKYAVGEAVNEPSKREENGLLTAEEEAELADLMDD